MSLGPSAMNNEDIVDGICIYIYIFRSIFIDISCIDLLICAIINKSSICIFVHTDLFPEIFRLVSTHHLVQEKRPSLKGLWITWIGHTAIGEIKKHGIH